MSVPASPPVAVTGGEAAITPARHAGRWVSTLVALGVVAILVDSAATNPRFEWGTVGRYLTSTFILAGVETTIMLTIITMVIGITLGTVVALMRLSANPLFSALAWLYVWIFRSTPLLVQLLFWYNLAALYPVLGIGIPFGPTLVSVSANAAITPLTAAVLGLGLSEVAYAAEIIRSGILSVDPGQPEAAFALGMSHWQVLRRIVLPQAMRVIVPPLGNETISTIKGTSLVSVISLADLLYSAQIVYARTFQVIPLLVVAVVWYLVVTSLLAIGQHFVEAHLARGTNSQPGRFGVRQLVASWMRLRTPRPSR